MSIPFFRLPVPVNDPTAPKVSAAAKPMFPPQPERGALAHWSFGKDASSLRDVLSRSTLQVNGATPTFEQNHLSLVSGGYNGLLSGIDDRAEFTVCMAIQHTEDRTLGEHHVAFGTTDVGASSGSMGWLSGGSTTTFNATSLMTRGGGGNISSPTDMTVGLAIGDWYFQAWSVSAASGRRIIMSPGSKDRGGQGAGGGDDWLEDNGATGLAVSSRNFAIGAVHYQNADYLFGLSIAEAIIFPTGLTPAQIVEVAKRSRLRARYRDLNLDIGNY